MRQAEPVFETAYRYGRYVRNSTKVIVILGTSFLLIAMENWLEEIIPLSGLLAVVSMAESIPKIV